MTARKPSRPDVQVEHHFSIVLVRPLTRKASRWIKASVQSDAQYFGGALVVEPRYLADLVTGMSNDGLIIVPSA